MFLRASMVKADINNLDRSGTSFLKSSTKKSKSVSARTISQKSHSSVEHILRFILTWVSAQHSGMSPTMLL